MTLTTRYTSLTDRPIFVTGGGSGIGGNLVYHLAQQGAKVAFIDIDEDSATTLCDQIEKAGYTRPHFQKVDVRDLEALTTSIDQAAQALGGQLYGLVNNAASDARHHIDEVTPEYWDNALNLNLRPHFFAMRAAAHHMTEGGAVINMGSVSWMRRRQGMVGYTTAKGAINALTRTMAQELGGQNIRVNCLVPGAILTERQQKLWLTPELEQEFLREQALPFRLVPDDVSAMALFLLADDSRGCSGQNFVVDGGIV